MKYSLENELLRLTVTTDGAQVCSVVHKTDGVEHIWQADPKVWGQHSPILFPYAGRLTDGVLTAKGGTYAGGPHGFARRMEHPLLEQTPDAITLELTDSEETRKLWPYRFSLQSRFTLEGDCLAHTLTVESRDEEPMPFGIGFHPAFALPFDQNHTSADYELRFSQPESPLCLGTLPSGLLHGDCYYLGRNIQSLDLGGRLFANDSHCIVNLSSQTLGVYEKDSGRAVVCEIADFPYTLLWGKDIRPLPFVCIEPWCSLPSPEWGSTEWNEKPAAAILAPGQRWSITLRTHFVR